ncbi:MAG: hypothetical protein FJ222_09215, partial [Lentisphaerae bacterium]|nr:hypothetical protein [Lentisphaerota bacterium]
MSSHQQWTLWRKQGLESLVQADLERLRARMYDVSEFVKTVKQRFSQWYNRREGRAGTLWEDRFKSVMIEPPSHAQRERQGVGALATMAAYIDLNAVRAGLASDPKDYRWCGYGEAVAGRKRAREGLAAVYGVENQERWRTVAARYRLMVYATGTESGLSESGVALVLADEFRDGNVPARQEPLPCTRAAFEALPGDVRERFFRGDS